MSLSNKRSSFASFLWPLMWKEKKPSENSKRENKYLIASKYITFKI